MRYVKKHTWKAFFNYFLLWTTICFSQTTSTSAAESGLWIEENIEEKDNIKTTFKTQQNEGLHIFAHGRTGEILLNDKWHNTEELAQWLAQKNLVREQNQINIYACNFAKGEKGKAAVQYLEQTLGICVAASDDITGIDGDWELEVGYSSDNLVVENYN